MQVTDTSPSSTLGKRAFARLTTYRNNNQPVCTAIWFALDNGKVVFFTGPATGKARRIRRNPRIKIGPATVRGELVGAEFEGTARLLQGDDVQAAHPHRLLAAKYGLQLSLMQFVRRLTRTESAYFEITPA